MKVCLITGGMRITLVVRLGQHNGGIQMSGSGAGTLLSEEDIAKVFGSNDMLKQREITWAGPEPMSMREEVGAIRWKTWSY